MESMFNLVGIIIIVFGVLQIILFFKIWGMTNDVKEMKNKFVSEEYSKIASDIRSIKDQYLKSTIGSETHTDQESNKIKSAKTVPQNKPILEDKTIPAEIDKVEEIDIESEDFQKLIRRWRVLKKKGFTQQAINEYMEKTSLPLEDAQKFIDEL